MSTSEPQKDNQHQPTPISTTADVVIEGQEPVPLSPIDRVRTSVEASIDGGLEEILAKSSASPQNNDLNTSTQQHPGQKALPLPASSSILGDEERPFAKPLRSLTSASAPEEKQQPTVVEPQQLEREKMDMDTQPAIAELPATPLQSPDLPSVHRDEIKQSPKRSSKAEDESVLYNLPVTPSAQAFEVATQNINAGYFDPVFPSEDASKSVPPIVEGGRS